ncbi:MAG: DNA-methyltransferase [Terriglobales bacterium]
MYPDFTRGREHVLIGGSVLIHDDCFAWMSAMPENSVHGIVTDPPYGLKEYRSDQLEKRANRSGGIWRIPPSFDGANRQPLPRFTALNDKERERLAAFFTDWAKLACQVLRPGGHVLIACNSFLCQLVYTALVQGGLEFRGQLIRLVSTFRGGDRPKNAEAEFPDTCSLPRGAYEPWGILRKPMPNGMTIGKCLKTWETGAIRRLPDGSPFLDVVDSRRTPVEERLIANHPSTKPQEFMREMVFAILPLQRGIILDPFMGSGSTIAAANALHRTAVGLEHSAEFFQMAVNAVPLLSAIHVEKDQLTLAMT